MSAHAHVHSILWIFLKNNVDHFYIYGCHGNATPTCSEHFEIFSNYFDKNCQ